jgi:hypothetical protein
VYVDGENGKSGIFTMKGGEITGNTSGNGGGVWINESGIFYMEGGEIRGNTAPTLDYYTGYGGGVFMFIPGKGSRIIKSGGTISGNIANEGGAQVFIYISNKSRTDDLGPGESLWYYYNGSEYGFD